MFDIARYTRDVCAVGLQAMSHERAADIAEREGRVGPMLSHWHEADRLWAHIFRYMGNDGAQWDRRKK